MNPNQEYILFTAVFTNIGNPFLRKCCPNEDISWGCAIIHWMMWKGKDDVGDCLLSFWGVLGDHAIVKEMLFMVEESEKKVW